MIFIIYFVDIFFYYEGRHKAKMVISYVCSKWNQLEIIFTFYREGFTFIRGRLCAQSVPR